LDYDVKTNDLVMLLRHNDQYGLAPGRLGRVLEVISADEVEVEFTDTSAHTIAKLPLKLTEVSVLRLEATIDENRFWQIVGDAKINSGGDPERQVRMLIDQLADMSLADIYAFGEIFHQLSCIAYRQDLWAAAYIMNSGCGDDSFTDFRAWLIAQGKKIFYDALNDPETLVDIVQIVPDEYIPSCNAFLEEMNYVPAYAYEKKRGEEEPLFPGRYNRCELVGEAWDEDKVYDKYPKLSAKFNPTYQNTD